MNVDENMTFYWNIKMNLFGTVHANSYKSTFFHRNSQNPYILLLLHSKDIGIIVYSAIF